MLGYRNDKSAERQRRRIVAAIGDGGARMPDRRVVALFVESAAWIDAGAMAEIDRILRTSIDEPLGPEFMAPPADIAA
jgi:hypothetical protein